MSSEDCVRRIGRMLGLSFHMISLSDGAIGDAALALSSLSPFDDIVLR